jgi:hypothetical protein
MEPDRLCALCRERLERGPDSITTICKHTFHFACLLERQQSDVASALECPACSTYLGRVCCAAARGGLTADGEAGRRERREDLVKRLHGVVARVYHARCTDTLLDEATREAAVSEMGEARFMHPRFWPYVASAAGGTHLERAAALYEQMYEADRDPTSTADTLHPLLELAWAFDVCLHTIAGEVLRRPGVGGEPWFVGAGGSLADDGAWHPYLKASFDQVQSLRDARVAHYYCEHAPPTAEAKEEPAAGR